MWIMRTMVPLAHFFYVHIDGLNKIPCISNNIAFVALRTYYEVRSKVVFGAQGPSNRFQHFQPHSARNTCQEPRCCFKRSVMKSGGFLMSTEWRVTCQLGGWHYPKRVNWGMTWGKSWRGPKKTIKNIPCFVMFSRKQIPSDSSNCPWRERPSWDSSIIVSIDPLAAWWCLVHLRSPWIKLVVWIPCDGHGWTRSHLRAGPKLGTFKDLQRSSFHQRSNRSNMIKLPKKRKYSWGAFWIPMYIVQCPSGHCIMGAIHSPYPNDPSWTFHNEGRFPPRLFFELDSTSANGSMEGASRTTIHYMSLYIVDDYNPQNVTHTVISNPRGSWFSGHQQYQDDNDVAISNPRIPKVSGHSNGPNTSENLWRRLMMHVLVQTPALQRWWKHLQCHIHQSCSGWVSPRIEESVAQIEISMRKMITKVDLSFLRCPIFRQASLLLCCISPWCAVLWARDVGAIELKVDLGALGVTSSILKWSIFWCLKMPQDA